MIWIWLGLVVTLTLIELLTTNLVTIWYIASALISLILSFFIDSYLIQFSVFAIVGTILLFTTRDYLLKILAKNKKKMDIFTEKKAKKKNVKATGKRKSSLTNKKIKVDSTIKESDER